MDIDLSLAITLVAVGILVGVINTFAGAAAAITISLYTALGLPITVANGTNRIPVLAQTMVTSFNFARQGLLDYKMGLRLGFPTVVGSIIGSLFASRVNVTVFTYMLTTVLVLLLVVLIFNPTKFTGASSLVARRDIRWGDYAWFFVIGLYGGAVHIGVGYVILAVTIMGMGYDLLSANALKGFIVMLYIPFSLAIFMINGQVCYTYGLIHAVGNIIGAFLASRYASFIGMKVVRWLLIVMIVVAILDLYGLLDIQKFVMMIL